MAESSEPRPLENLRSGGYNAERHVAEELVEGGRCASYDEAYKVLKGMKSGDVVQTYRGFMRKQ